MLKQDFQLQVKVILSIGAAALFLTSGSTSAQQSTLPIQVAPARQELNVNPGEKANFTVRFYNFDELPTSGQIKAADFLVQSSNGKPRIIDNPALASPKYSGSQWITLPYDEISIAGKDKVTVQGSISVPKDARPGGRYVAIYFEANGNSTIDSSSNSTALNIAPRLVGLLYIRVAGDITENATVLSFVAPHFAEYGPIEVSTLILNNGDYHINPKGMLTLENTLTGELSQQILKEQNIFPGSSLLYKNSLGKHLMIGKYKLTFQAAYGEKGQALMRTEYVWVFPWRIAIAILLGILIVLFIGKRLARSMRGRTDELAKELETEKSQIDQLKEQLRRTRER